MARSWLVTVLTIGGLSLMGAALAVLPASADTPQNHPGQGNTAAKSDPTHQDPESPARRVPQQRPPTPDPQVRRDIEYGKVDGHALKLDFYPPGKSAHGADPGAVAPDSSTVEQTIESTANSGQSEVTRPSPLIVWVHGGAWRRGSKDSVPILALRDYGYAIASVEYRLSPVAPFPAQVLDIKNAVDFLHQNQGKFDIDPSRTFVAGASAGGHLAALVGISGGVKAIEPEPPRQSRISGIVSFYGASNLHSILSQSTEHGLSVRVPALELLLGGQPHTVPEMATLASPVTHVSQDDPPLLLIHGTADPQMPPEQSQELHDVYRKAGLKSRLVLIRGAKHGGKEFYTPKMIAMVHDHLKRSSRSFDTLPIRPSPANSK